MILVFFERSRAPAVRPVAPIDATRQRASFGRDAAADLRPIPSPLAALKGV
jgi:hypothetical protein